MYFDSTDFTNFIVSFVNSLAFLFNATRDLLTSIIEIDFIWWPLWCLVIMCFAYGVGWLVLELSPYGYISNPYNQINYKKLGGVVDIYSISRKVKRNKEQQVLESQRVNERLTREHENQVKATMFFENNPHSYKVSIDGKTYWRDGWEFKRWDKDGEIKEVIHYEKDSSGYLKEKYSTFTSRSDYTGKVSEPSFDIELAKRQAIINRQTFGTKKVRKKKNIDISVDENSD